MMGANVGSFDRGLRIVLGLVLFGWALGYIPGTQSSWGWIGVIPLLTALTGFCPLYALIGANTYTRRA